ncbi:MAG: hypothetical protein KC422_20150 [Trueperaceae bacterium]|nr:hypothetical protein [Trueperaceae bacterium]
MHTIKLLLAICLALLGFAQAQVKLERLATGLLNPRGVVVLSPDELIVVEAGSGNQARQDGKISRFSDHNQDGDFDDAGERKVLLESLPSYNGLYTFGTGHDEVGGASDIIWANNQLYFTFDNPKTSYLADGLENDIRVQALSLDGKLGKTLVRRSVTLNSLSYNPENQTFYVVESGSNSLLKAKAGETFEYLTLFLPLAHGQQAVPAAVALDPTNGDVLVALFSGQVFNGSDFDSYFPGDSKVVRIDAVTGEQRDEITGLTTAVDLVLDEQGNIFVLELTSGEPLEKLEADFPLYDLQVLPLPGGYPRQSGRLSLYKKGEKEPVVLLENLDAPSNLSYAQGAIYISTGQGTPGRYVMTEAAETFQIEGEILRLTGLETTK